MDRLSLEQRSLALERMAGDGVDVLVVGGGITGAGVALDAAARGYRVGLVDRADFAAGTSSKSTKLVHGGIRYLSQFDFGLTHESLVERGLLLHNAPYLVQPIGFLLPLYAGAKRPMGSPIRLPFGVGMGYVLRAGLLVYDLMAGKLRMRFHRRITLSALTRLAPCLRAEGLEDAFIYYDGQTDDTRLTVAVLRTAARVGAAIANYAAVDGFDMDDAGQITAARVSDRLNGGEYTIPVRKVVNAAGVFAGRVEALAGHSNIKIKPAKGVHLTVPREAVKLSKYAVVLPETDDGRLLFLVPWGPRVTIGTTDTEGGDVNDPTAGPEDIAYLLRHVNRYMGCQLTEADIISSWAGYRPLVSSSDSVQSSRLSRTHAVIDGPGGMVTIVGGKLTTYRRMAQDTMDHIARLWGDRTTDLTAHLPLAGSDGWKQAWEDLKAEAHRYGISANTARRLALYGSDVLTLLEIVSAEPSLAERVVPDLPYIMAEVVYACRYEMAVTLGDVLERRLHINIEDWSRGVECAPAVARVMARELGWSEAATREQVERYVQGARPSRPAGADAAPAAASAAI